MSSMAKYYELLIEGLDYPFGWLLLLPRDWTLVLIALATALAMTLVRRWCTDQNVLKCCQSDLKRLRELLRDARRAGDKDAVQRFRGTTALVKTIQLRADLRVLALVIVPVGLLATWSAERLDYLPLRVDEEIVLRAYYPFSSAGKMTHLVPSEPVFSLQSSAIQVIQPDPADSTQTFAVWHLVVHQPADDLSITIRHQDDSAAHHLRVGRADYLPARQTHTSERIRATEVLLERYSFLGLLPKINILGLAPWLVAYLLIAIPLVPALRRLLRVA